jgi:hypothetical protein
MVLSLDAFDERRQLAAGEWDCAFVVFNSTNTGRESELIFPIAMERAATIAHGDSPDAVSNPVPLHSGRCPIRLEPGEIRWFNVVVPQIQQKASEPRRVSWASS